MIEPPPPRLDEWLAAAICAGAAVAVCLLASDVPGWVFTSWWPW